MMDELLLFSNNLQAAAKKVLKCLDLESRLSHYGVFRIVGSLKHELMVWRDIDIDLITQDTPNEKEFWDIVTLLFTQKNVKSVTLADNRNHEELNRPKSMYIGLKYEDAEKCIWKIDIRLVSKSDATSDQAEDILKQVNKRMKLRILQIKHQVYKNPNYHKSFSSMDIYEAVVTHKVSTYSDFEAYLHSIGKIL
jgi:hypothetical protein